MNETMLGSIHFCKSKVYHILIVLSLCTVPLIIHNPYYVHTFIMFLFFASLGLAWNIIGGYGGQFSLGHTVFYGIGAYTSTLLFVHYNLSPWFGMFIGGLLALFISLPIGYPCFRLHGPFFTMSTLAVGEVSRLLVVYYSDLTGGSTGISIPIKFGFKYMVFEGKTAYLYIIMVFFLLVVLINQLIERSRFGHQLIALRDDEDAAESLGINVNGMKLKAMMVSSFLTAIAGSFHAQYALYIDPSGEFSLGLSMIMAIMCILGGVGTILGPILGAAILVPLQEFLRGYLAGQLYGLHLLIYGILLILVVTFLPNGIFEWLKKWITPWVEKLPRFSVERPEEKGIREDNFLSWGWITRNRIDEDGVILRTRKLCKSFGGLNALSNLDVDIRQGKITGLIGPNGAGKTTLFNVISGFYRADAGNVEYNRINITQLQPAHHLCHIGMGRTFQVVKPFGNITVLKNVMVGAFCRADSYEKAEEDALEISDFVGLYNKKDSLAKTLTIGDRKRLELARALATRPNLLLLDEIMAGLNPKETEEAIALINKIREQGITVLLIEHVMRAVMNLSDWIIILHHGEKIAEGIPREVASDETVIRAYLGEEYVIA